MARTDTLANYITDVCAAVKEKAGITGKINASEIDNIIRSIQSGGGAEPNIFIQEEEPETKEGLWIKSSDIQVDKTVVDENVFVATRLDKLAEVGYVVKKASVYFGVVDGKLVAGPKTDVEVEEKEEPVVHTVKAGECLWGIARNYYGTGKKWSLIYDANKDEISNPDLIIVNQKLIIPTVE